MKYISCLLLLLQINSYGFSYAQINGNNDTTVTGTEIRTRLLSGIVARNYAIEDDVSLWFINLNVRSSLPPVTSAKPAAAIEAGMNIWQSLLAPYFKAGPELKFSNNLYIDAQLGLVLPIYDGILFSTVRWFDMRLLFQGMPKHCV